MIIINTDGQTKMKKTHYFNCSDLPFRFGETGCCAKCHLHDDDFFMNNSLPSELFEYEKEIFIKNELLNLYVSFCCRKLPPRTLNDWYSLWKGEKKQLPLLPDTTGKVS
jgi:hypothetical protein